ncbi:MAG: outer membrane beta-barrel protein [Pseudomonadota bacterium]
MKSVLSATALVLAGTSGMATDLEVSLYLGLQEAPHSRVTGNDATGAPDEAFNFLSTWEGRSFQAPPHYGVRATWWRPNNWGFGVELNHTKVYADDETLEENNFDRLEFTDGLNIITANAFYRWPDLWLGGRLSPYVGAGLGIAVPHVDVERNGTDTFEYQFTGPAMMLAGGVAFDLNENWAIFTEYKGTYSRNEADLDGGGTLETDIVTNAINFGVTYKF